ncbi:alpha/beta hydrolase family protein [Paenibacillus solani]|uniref:Acetylhydrolase n=1 Tax=Paenibacillus solani TaxID=1705565 RepID=A0A0M1P472_9BACL|nr:dienelactone hydrolase family protein [Paenibacillus solani]KOR89283.1 acetylhydrolase [Paenibacillus solani]
MEILILVVTLVFELAIAVYSIVTKQSRSKIKSWTRIAMFIVFMILSVGKVVVWEYTWGLFAGLLFILAFKEMVALLRNQTHHTPRYKVFSPIWKFLLLAPTVVVTLVPVLLFPQHRLPQVTGPYPVATATYSYADKNRIEEFTDQKDNRFVNVEFWYPEQADGTYPLLVFSHGAFGIKTSNTSTFTELASHGYVVVSIDHPYHSFYTVSEDGKVVTINPMYMQEVNNANKGVYSLGEFFELTQKWMKLRTDDMDFVMDTILEQAEQKKDSVYKRIDTQKIGVFGHSMGGAASIALSRERDDIDAVVNIDAPFFSELVYDKVTNELKAKSEAYTIPLLNVYSDDVWIQLDSSSSYIANRISNENFKGAYTVHFKGAKHLSLTDLPLFSPILANLLQQGRKADIDKYYAIETQNELILRFFDYALKNQGQFAPKATY